MELLPISAVTGAAAPSLATADLLNEWGHLSINGNRSGISTSHHRRDTPACGGPYRRATGSFYTIVVSLRTVGPTDFFLEGRHFAKTNLKAGGLAVYDTEANWMVEIRQPFHSFEFWMSKAAIGELVYDTGASRAGTRSDLNREQTRDPIMYYLAQALLPSMRSPACADSLFVSSLFLAAKNHLIRNYGRCFLSPASEHGVLAPWRYRLAREMISESLASDIVIEDLASACDLSPSHFARSFKRTAGITPHQWKTRCRIEKAKALLLDRNETLSGVAASCGFADQSHLGKVFSCAVGVTPGAWQRGQS